MLSDKHEDYKVLEWNMDVAGMHDIVMLKYKHIYQLLVEHKLLAEEGVVLQGLATSEVDLVAQREQVNGSLKKGLWLAEVYD